MRFYETLSNTELFPVAELSPGGVETDQTGYMKSAGIYSG